MFETWFFLLLQHLFTNVIIPIFTWILFIWILFWKKLKGFILYIISFFIWVWIISSSLFNLQFIYFWVWIFEYFIINIILIIILITKIFLKKQKTTSYIDTLKMHFSFEEIKKSFKKLTLSKKILSILSLVFVFWFSTVAFIFNSNFPTYADDSFGNWHTATINIHNDGWIKLFWKKEGILWRWREWYPIYIPTYKAFISKINWWFNDIYINLLQYLWFLFFIIFIFKITFEKTKNIFLWLFPLVLICGLPLVFFHSVEWYMELYSAIYSVFFIYFLHKFLEKNDYNNLVLWFLFWFFLINIKNEWLIVYFIWICFAFLTVLLLQKKLIKFFKELYQKHIYILKIFLSFCYISLPFFLIRFIYWLWFNPVKSEKLVSFHPEIFNYFPVIFIREDNYNISIIFIVLFSIILCIKYINFKKIYNLLFPYLSFLYIFIIFTLVFLLTDNYKWVLNQTTVNRVFTMSFVILFSFSWLFFDFHKSKKNIIYEK